MSAIGKDTPGNPLGPWAKPGEFTIRLTADGTVRTQLLKLLHDPRQKSDPPESGGFGFEP
jgi:hypothetical protein